MDTKTNLLDAAEALARSRGFDAFSYADLASAVGIRKASIHHHFPAKADLALALIDRYAARVQHILAELTASGANAADRLTGYLSLYREALKDGEQICLCVAYSAGRDSFSPDVLTRLEAFHAAGTDWLEAVYTLGVEDRSIAQGRDPASEARATLALVEGAQIIARATKNIALFDAATESLRARIR
jgi:TetR/AcrR family transcriptional repressor of nem operon